MEALYAAATRLRENGVVCEIVENQKPRMYYTAQTETCEYVLKLEGKFDVGFKAQEDDTYAPMFDEWGKHVGNEIGADVNVCPMPTTQEGRAQHQIGQFMQAYSEAAAVNAAVANGYTIDDTHTDEQGNVHLVLGNV